MADNIGEWSGTKKATEEIQQICAGMKSQVEEQTNKKYVEFKAVEYRSEEAELRMNYLIKVHVGGANYDHLLISVILVPPMEEFKLLGVRQHKTKDDPLVPFKG